MMSTVDKASLRKGGTVIACMRRKLKDRWSTAYNIRNRCDRGGSYTREILETHSELNIIEKREVPTTRIEYRVDPEGETIICPIQPDVPYDESICRKLEPFVEELVRLRSVCNCT